MMSEIVIKVITGSWCSSCQSLKASLEQNNIEYKAIDVDDFENQEYIAKLGVRALPVTVLEVDGVVKAKIQGLISVASLRKTIEDVVAEATAEMEGK